MCYARINDQNLTSALATRIQEMDADELAVVIPMLMAGVKYADYDENGDWIIEFEDKGMALFHIQQTNGLKLLNRAPDVFQT